MWGMKMIESISAGADCARFPVTKSPAQMFPIQRLVRSVIRRARLMSADQAGSTVVLMALSLPVVLGGLGVGVDTGAWYMEKRRVQQIADSAALGGARAMASGVSLTTAKAVATRDAARNG